MVQITLEDNSQILATDQHPFWSETRAAYLPAVEVHQGEELRDAKNGRITVRSTRIYSEDLLAYNLTIRNIHTYYAGENPVLVHNCAPTKITGYTKHGLESAMNHDGRGIKPSAILHTVRKGVFSYNKKRGTFEYKSSRGFVALNKRGQVVTTYARGHGNTRLRKGK